MRLRAAAMKWLPLIFLSVWCVHAKKDSPRIVTKTFDSAPVNLQYFKGSNSVLVFEAEAGTLWRSGNSGEKWEKAKEKVIGFYLHPHDSKKAYAFGSENIHWTTDDRGETWNKFELDEGLRPARQRVLAFHAKDTDKVIFNVEKCRAFLCEEEAIYTTDNFNKVIKSLRKDTRGCVFAHGSPEFVPSENDKDDSRVFCVVKSRSSSRAELNRLLTSDKYFADDGLEPLLHDGRTVQGIINIAVEKKFLITAAKGEGSFELALYVSSDSNAWHRAEFPNNPKLEQDAYTILESSNYSIQVDVMTTRPMNPMGILFSSDSTGKYFTENIKHTNRNFMGYVDYEKVQGIQGIVLVNVVENWEEIEKSTFAEKKIKSKMSFDDGRTFHALKALKKKDSKEEDGEIHVHSVTEITNSGRIFSSPAPGIIMAIGNKGEYLKPYSEGDLYISDNAGLTWYKGLEEAHKYEIGGQGSVLMAVFDEGPTDSIRYSIDHGVTWEKAELEDEVTAKVLTQTPDSTSLKFILEATRRHNSKTEYQIIMVDFEGLHERECKKDDFEDWYARLDDDGKPDCIMGHKQKYRRRKWDADCFVEDEFEESIIEEEKCSCTEEDFECDFGFVREGKECKSVKGLSPPEDACRSDDKTFKGPSGWRLIPGNTCDRKGKDAVEKDGNIDHDCEDTKKPPPVKSGKLSFELTKFPANAFGQRAYLEKGSQSNDKDETIVMRTISGDGENSKIYITRDHGKTWTQPKKLKDAKEDIIAVIPHAYNNDMVFFVTATDTLYYSANRGETIDDLKVPEPMNRDRIAPLGFHPDKKDWFIWTGAHDCDNRSKNCHSVSYYTTNRGYRWDPLVRYCKKCEFVKTESPHRNDKLVYCEKYKDEKLDNPIELRSSIEWFSDDPKPHFDDILAFATMSEFIIVARKDPKSNLQVEASVDGKTFAQAEFPPGFDVPVQTAYTLLDSSTHSVFLHVTVGSRDGFEYGQIMKSNSNGTSYVSSIAGVNRNSEGYVDFEKMQGLEGVAMVNVVANLDEESNGQTKKLRSMITHNDGAEWTLMKAPEKDHNGKAFCDVSDIEECSLHLHSYTERGDPTDTFSSSSAVGLMMGVGNVGKYLSRKKGDDVYTFITRDGGVSWVTAKKGNYMWEYGDQGSIIVIVEEDVETNHAFYTLDEGRTWNEFEFSDKKMTITDLTTVPSDSAVNFLLWGKKGGEIFTVNVDFSGIRDRECVLDEKHGDDVQEGADEGDYTLWLAKHPLQQNGCLFGHKALYHRKKFDADCRNGRKIVGHHEIDENCECTRQDFECDYNYEITSDRQCLLIEDHSPINPLEKCKNDPSLTTYFSPSGYRKIPLSTCAGGDEHKFLGEELPCPGHEKEYEDSHRGLGGFWIFILAVVLPFCAAGGIGYWVYTNHGGAFGRIRLGEQAGSAFDADRPWIHYPVAALSAVVAVLAAVPVIIGAAWRGVSGLWGAGGGRYTTARASRGGEATMLLLIPTRTSCLGRMMRMRFEGLSEGREGPRELYE